MMNAMLRGNSSAAIIETKNSEDLVQTSSGGICTLPLGSIKCLKVLIYAVSISSANAVRPGSNASPSLQISQTTSKASLKKK